MSDTSDGASQRAPRSVTSHFRRILYCGRGGQAFVEFALILVVALIILFVAVQMALLGQASLALGQMNYQGARYAAQHPDCDLTSCANGEQSIQSFMLSVGSPTITQSNGQYLTITVNPSAPRQNFKSVQVNVSFDASPLLVLCKPSNGSCSFLGIPFPTTLQSSETAMTE
jgi:Flp pilus assembly protein TadG